MEIKQAIFDQEIKICKQNYNQQGGCYWGKCRDCGAVPLLHKLATGQVVEQPEQVEQLKNKLLSN